jgi:hypothetical protein
MLKKKNQEEKMKKRSMFLVGVVLAVVLLVGATSCTAADLKDYQGILQKVDSLSGNVTVTLTDNTTMTFNLSDIDLKALRGHSGNVSLEPGDNVTIGKGRNGEIKELKARYAVVQGTIKSLGTENVTSTAAVFNKITLTTKDGDITLKVTANTTIIRGWGAKKPALSDLQVGQRVVVKYDVVKMEALTITVNADGKIQDNKKYNDDDDKGNRNKNSNIQSGNQNREREHDN